MNNNVKILDCTLRDGGRIINCTFPDSQTRRIIHYLQQAGIDIIEVGFLRDWRNVTYSGDSTFFTRASQIAPLLPKERRATYVAFIDFGMFDIDSLEPYDGTSIDGIRLGFTKKDHDQSFDEVVRWAETIKAKGYKLFLQGVNTLNYSDLELLELLAEVDRIKPASFGIVDTYGAMYIGDVRRLYSLADHNLDPDIAIDFHSHNNYQLSFSFAQEVISLSDGVRNVVIDTTLRGMGKGAGNANTELVVDYLARKKGYPYDLEKVLEVIDLDIYDLYEKTPWGYSPASFMGGVYKSHPNNIIYLLSKYRFTTNDIKNILAMLTDSERQRYPYDRIDELCDEYCFEDHDDSEGMEELRKLTAGREVLVLAPGRSLQSHKSEIDEYVRGRDPVIISVNFLSDYEDSLAFFGNKKRYYAFCYDSRRRMIVTSDIATGSGPELVISAKRFISSSKMGSVRKLLDLLYEVGVRGIGIAGMDGYSANKEDNYYDRALTVERTLEETAKTNARLQVELDDFMKRHGGVCHVRLVTPSVFKLPEVYNGV